MPQIYQEIKRLIHPQLPSPQSELKSLAFNNTRLFYALESFRGKCKTVDLISCFSPHQQPLIIFLNKLTV